MECEICFQEWKSDKVIPKSLQCGHTICKDCIKGLVKTAPVKCPFCKVKLDVTAATIDKLPTNFAILSMAEDAKTNIIKNGEEAAKPKTGMS